jgi:uncharacterized repeat protein (TIGR03803 family)
MGALHIRTFLRLIYSFVCLLLIGCAGGGVTSNLSTSSSHLQPSITSLSPSSAPVAASSQTLSINGSGFLATSTVTFNGVSHAPTFVSSQQMTVILNADDLANIGDFAVVVTNPAPSGGQSLPAKFRVKGGSVQVNISGLPPGTPASVVITSSPSFNSTISLSQTMQLPPATYTVTINPVPVATTNYYASPATQALEVVDGSSTALQVLYSVIIPSTTKVLDNVGSQSLVVSPDNTTLTISAASPVAASLAPGDILAIGVTPSTPMGLLRQIVSTSQNGGQIVLTTVQGTLAEAFQQASFSYKQSLSPQNLRVVGALRPGVTIYRGVRPSTSPKSLPRATALADPCAANLATFVRMFDTPIIQDSSGAITATGQIEVCPSLQFDWSIGSIPPQLNSLTATATLGGDLHVNVTGRYDSSFDQKVPVVTLVASDPITVFIGPVPIVVVPKLVFFVGTSGDVTVGFSAGVTQTATATAGITYSNGQASPVSNISSHFGADPFGIDGGLSTKAYAGVTIDIDVDGVLSPELSPDAFLQLAVDPTQNPWWTLSGGLEGSGDVGVSIFGFVNLVDFQFPNLFEWPTPPKIIAQATGGFLVADAAPTLGSIQPNAVPLDSPDLTLVLTGANFVPGSTVIFNGTALPTIFIDPGDLTATVGPTELATAGTFPITVTNPDTPGAVSNAVNFTVSGSSSNPLPSISSLSPPAAAVGTSSQNLTINGQNFLSTSTVTYNGIAHSATFLNTGQLAIALSASDLATAGAFPVVVTNPSPGGGTSNAVNFAVGNPIPAVASISPDSVPVGSSAQTVTINGNNFLTSSVVSVNGSTYTPTFISNTQLSIVVASADLATAGTFLISVTNPTPGGGTSNSVTLTVSSTSIGSVNVTPASATVPEGGVQTFSASVAGSVDGVKWSIQEGSAAGDIVSFSPTTAIYIPPNVTGTFHLVATNADDPAKTQITTITVIAPLTLDVLHSFQGSDGAWPTAGLIQASDGYFYGTTSGGGTADSGTVFKVDTSGNLMTLYSFDGSNGGTPFAGLIQAADGNFYGTTFYGGTGTAFEMNSSGSVTILHSFVPSGSDGANPYGGLIHASDGNFYGTTYYGGTTNAGTIFRMDASGNVTFLHSFSTPNGAAPYAAPIQGSDGNFYGTTYYGGEAGGPGAGVVYKMDAGGTVTVLHSFSGPDGEAPFAGLIQTSDGNLYGTTLGGGVWGVGTVFKIDTSGNLTVLHSFEGLDGASPQGALIQGNDGNFYGTTSGGGTTGSGTIFKMDPSGNVTVLHSFTAADGAVPEAGLTQGTDGNLYGTTYGGGTGVSGVQAGVVFRLALH